jgi:LCP family protein required for cell wall assembly
VPMDDRKRTYRTYRGGRAPKVYRHDTQSRRHASDAEARADRRTHGGAGAAPGTRQRRFRWWFVPVGLLVLFLILGGVAFAIAYPGYRTIDKAVRASNARVNAATRAQLTTDAGSLLSHPTTILVLGIDSSHGLSTRSDTITMIRFDPTRHTVSQLSIPRDSRVPVPGHGLAKINAAFSWGSAPLALRTIHDFTGVPIDHIVMLDFVGLWRVVRAVGGVDVYVPRAITVPLGTGQWMTFKKGWNHMGPHQALVYVRIRHIDDDFHRMARQQAFMQALEKKIAQPKYLLKLPEISTRLLSGIATDITTWKLFELAYLKWRTPAKQNVRLVLTGTPRYIGGVDYVIVDPAQKQALVRRFLGQ